MREMTCSLPETLRPFLHRRTAGVSSAKEVRGARRRASDEGRYVMGLGRLCARGVQNGRLRKDRFGEKGHARNFGELWEWNCRVFRCGSRLASKALLPLQRKG